MNLTHIEVDLKKYSAPLYGLEQKVRGAQTLQRIIDQKLFKVRVAAPLEGDDYRVCPDMYINEILKGANLEAAVEPFLVAHLNKLKSEIEAELPKYL